MRLPDSFLQNMRALLGEEEYGQYLSAMEKPYAQALRVNPLKVSPQRLRELLPEAGLGDEVPWCPEGIYLTRQTPVLSKHPYYAAGLYYLQEPSAMAPASFLPVSPGDRVLDLCAAPGGKSTALGARLAGKGLLVSNDISASRARALLKNLELFGISNAAVFSENPYRLAGRFAHFFDRVLVDAPCSGEGMFRKDPSVAKNWEQYGNEYYGKLQREILSHAAVMTAPGGMLLYSTCTFSPLEDEQTVEEFLRLHPDFHLAELPKPAGVRDGQPQWSLNGQNELKRCARFWPHTLQGEGHFVALLVREGERDRAEQRDPDLKSPREWDEWALENLGVPGRQVLPQGSRVVLSGEKLYAMLLDGDRCRDLRILRPGLLLGEIAHGRFEPSQALAMTLSRARRQIDLDRSDERIFRYLKGETLSGDFQDGWNLVTVSGFPVGWGKASGGILKNKYLKGWRALK